ncbi:adenosylcobinamide-GDP ribazoletransferase [Arenibaculum sp.]|jgi:adenosylcobinamide-GDP ribazoletransferase|uniref:adenosylcobinamide-GDP ribazoletransferase n=1 Tax=Arenibaculum sp. TaxID=2865862 RepID=UPI002E1612AA|nr:adenosylcobinamide-GDP ribazoletransferase [Arenibaculum sp.]
MDQSVPPRRLPAPFDEIAAAAIFLTRLPIRWPGEMPPDLHPRSLAWYPLVGAALGLAAGVALVLCAWAGLPAPLAALVAVAALVALTGALHEDGLADVADGFGGGRDRAAKLAIMRDSRVGTYGVLALGFGQAIRVVALAAMPGPAAAVAALVAAGALSRAVVPAVYAYLPPARADGLAATLPPPPGGRVVAALALGAALAGLALGAAALPAIAAALLAAMALALLAERQIGGRTGDVLGAGQQVAEIAVLLVLAGLLE